MYVTIVSVPLWAGRDRTVWSLVALSRSSPLVPFCPISYMTVSGRFGGDIGWAHMRSPYGDGRYPRWPTTLLVRLVRQAVTDDHVASENNKWVAALAGLSKLLTACRPRRCLKVLNGELVSSEGRRARWRGAVVRTVLRVEFWTSRRRAVSRVARRAPRQRSRSMEWASGTFPDSKQAVQIRAIIFSNACPGRCRWCIVFAPSRCTRWSLAVIDCFG
jgi:hypothetical protein